MKPRAEMGAVRIIFLRPVVTRGIDEVEAMVLAVFERNHVVVFLLAERAVMDEIDRQFLVIACLAVRTGDEHVTEEAELLPEAGSLVHPRDDGLGDVFRR